MYIVADGVVGGNNSGEVASRTAVSEIAEYVKKNDIRRNCRETRMIFWSVSHCHRTRTGRYTGWVLEIEENRGMATT